MHTSSLDGTMLKILLLICICIQLMIEVTPFGINNHQQRRKTLFFHPKQRAQGRPIGVFTGKTQLHVDNQHHDDDTTANDANDIDSGSSYQSSASLIKGIVSSLTSLTNSISQNPSSTSSSSPAQADRESTASSRGPTSPQELLSRISNEYTQNNYLWTGDLDTSSFVSNCTFTDPTLSFVGVDKYVENVGNLVPVVNYLLGDEQLSRSELLNITLNDEEKYIETRWNMVGELNRLLWKPKIDVIGRTKFWYQEEVQEEEGEGDPAVQVYFYDEMWEIPAGLALLQLVTKAGTIANTGEKN